MTIQDVINKLTHYTLDKRRNEGYILYRHEVNTEIKFIQEELNWDF